MTEPAHPDQTLTGAVVPPGAGPAATGDSSSTGAGKQAARWDLYLELLAQKGVPLLLIAVGLGMVAADDDIEVNRVAGWGEPEYVGMLAFAALLIVLGWLERIVQLRSARAPSVEPQRTGNGGPPARPRAGRSSSDGG